MRRLRALAASALVGLLGVAVAMPVAAAPSSDEVADDLQTARERLQEIELEASAVVDEYNAATAALDEVTAELEATEAERRELRAEVDQLTELAGEHARRLHKLGPTMELSPVLALADGGDLGAGATTLQHILDGQRADLEQLSAATTELEHTEERLAAQRAKAREREEEVASQRAEVERTLSSYEDEIAELQEELAEAEAREERERREAEEQARREEAERARREAEREAAAQEQQQEETTSTAGDNGSSGSSGSSGSGGSSSDERTSQQPAPSSRQGAGKALDTALAQVGKPYQWGGSGPGSFDCSGLTSYAWRAAGVSLPRTSRAQWGATRRVSRGELQAGDLVFYSSNGAASGIGHVAMYTGRGSEVVEAPYTGANVRVRGDGLSRSDILGFGRV